MKRCLLLLALLLPSALPGFGQDDGWPATVWRQDALEESAQAVLRVTSLDSNTPVTVQVAWLVGADDNPLLIEEKTTPFEIELGSETFGALLKRTAGLPQMKVEVVIRSKGAERVPLQGTGEAVILNNSRGRRSIQAF